MRQVSEVMPDSSPSRQAPPNGNGEHKTGHTKQLRLGRQLSTETGMDKPASLDTRTPVEPGGEVTEAVRQEAMAMLASPELATLIVNDVHELGVVGEDKLIWMTYVTGTCRLMNRAIQLCVFGGSSTGKSKTVGKVLDLFPAEEVIRATQLTAKHLLNLKEEDSESYRHRIIFIGEMTSRDGDLVFREMAESAEVRNLTVREGVSVVSVAKGPITYICTTTLRPETIKGEDASRMFFFPTDDSSEQTERVNKSRAQQAKSGVASGDKRAILDRHHAAQQLLQDHLDILVRVPYADLIQLPTDDPGNRRLYDRIMCLVEAVTFMGQFREGRVAIPGDATTGGVRTVNADARDWEIALPLIDTIVRQKLGILDQRGAEFLERVKGISRGTLSVQQIAGATEMSETTIRRRIEELPGSTVTRNWDGLKFLYEFSHENGTDHLVQSIGLPTVTEVEEYMDAQIGGELENCSKQP